MGIELPRQRLASLGLIDPSAQRSPLDAVRLLLAAQSQDLASGKWSLAVRSTGATEAMVDAAIADATIVRAWPMRGTIHLVAAEDLHWLLGLTSPSIIAGQRGHRARLGLTDAALDRARVATIDALTGGRSLDRNELKQVIVAAGGAEPGDQASHALYHLAQTMLICYGPTVGPRPRFVLIDDLVPTRRELSRHEALRELAVRYFTGHGPATMHDLARWSNLPMADAREAIALARPDLAASVVDGVEYFAAAQSDAVMDRAASSALLLPGFDEYILGYRDRSPMIAPRWAERIVPGNNGIFLPTMVDGGAVIGIWRRITSTRSTVVELRPFRVLGARPLARFRRAANRYAAYVGLPLDLRVIEPD